MLHLSRSSSVSATSSVFEFVEEHGRTFHSYKAGSESTSDQTHAQSTCEYSHTQNTFYQMISCVSLGNDTMVGEEQVC